MVIRTSYFNLYGDRIKECRSRFHLINARGITLIGLLDNNLVHQRWATVLYEMPHEHQKYSEPEGQITNFESNIDNSTLRSIQ